MILKFQKALHDFKEQNKSHFSTFETLNFFNFEQEKKSQFSTLETHTSFNFDCT